MSRCDNHSEINIVVTSRYIKINAYPFFFDLDLKDEIIEEESNAVIEPGKEVLFKLKKSQPKMWNEIKLQGPKDEIMKIRQESLEKHQKKLNEVAL